MRRARVFAAIGLAAYLALVGCTAEDSPTPTSDPGEVTTPVQDPDDSATGSPEASAPTGGATEPTPIQFRVVVASGISESSTADLGDLAEEFEELDCATSPRLPEVAPDEPQVSCDGNGIRYALEPAVLETVVASAQSQTDESGNPLITIELDAPGAEELKDVTEDLASTDEQLGLVVDGAVLDAPTIQAPIENGILQIAGSLSEEEAADLVRVLTSAR